MSKRISVLLKPHYRDIFNLIFSVGTLYSFKLANDTNEVRKKGGNVALLLLLAETRNHQRYKRGWHQNTSPGQE